MLRQKIGQTGIEASRLMLGCMRMASLDQTQAENVIQTCLENGINHFDHADIYGKGESEKRFGEAIRGLGLRRDELIIQSKCGIQKGYYDLSKAHILASVEGILERLGIDELDFLLLHRPDALMDPEEVAEAFYQLEQAGKVRHFGVSNFNVSQIALLQQSLDKPLAINQMQLSPAHTPLIDAGLHVNMKEDGALLREDGVLDYCRLQGMTLQAWSPFQVDLEKGLFLHHPSYIKLTKTLEEYAAHYDISVEAVVIAWLLRHPAKMQVVIGSMNPERLEKIAQASQITLTRQEWYDIYISGGNTLP